MLLDRMIFRISVPDYLSRTVKSKSLRLYWNFRIFCLLYILQIYIQYDKIKTAKFGFSIFDMFSQVV